MRSDSVNIALLVHVLGAMVLLGGLITAAFAGIVGWRDEGVRLWRFSYWTLLAVGLPGYIVMRIGAQWVEVEEGWDDVPDDQSPAWIGIGYITADAGALLMVIALILGGIGIRKTRSGGGGGLLRASAVISTVLVLVYIVAVWAMGAKPD